jgi:hypothetical protein
MAFISVSYDLPLPNDFLVDHSQSEGNTREATYHGPDRLYLQLDKDTHVEKYGPLTAEDLADGRPIPVDCYVYEVDCVENPLICHLRGPIVNELQDDYTDEVVHPESPVIEGYPQFTYQTPLKPEDVFNKFSVKLVDGVLTVDAFTVSEKLGDRPVNRTWDEVRAHRDRLLESSDGQIPIDAPESLVEEFRVYRQRLRDLPTIMQENNVPAHIAFYMFPEHPHASKTPRNTPTAENGV